MREDWLNKLWINIMKFYAIIKMMTETFIYMEWQYPQIIKQNNLIGLL
jgi:hypothetical protein